MAKVLAPGDCVKIPDGRVGRLRDVDGARCRVRVQRMTSKTHQFVWFERKELKKVECPAGWMSPEGYNRYLKTTLAKMRKREAGKPRRRSGKVR